jgi:hypothetical protein
LLGAAGGRGAGAGGGGLAAQNFEHHRAAGRAFALDGLASVFHGFFDAIGDFPLGLAFDAISFSHKNFTANASCGERLEKSLSETIRGRNPERFLAKQLKNKHLLKIRRGSWLAVKVV